jgi:hypothetical protein
MKLSGHRGGEYLEDLIYEEIMEWGLLDDEIDGGVYGEERGRDERNAKRRKKGRGQTIVQARALVSLAHYRKKVFIPQFFLYSSGADVYISNYVPRFLNRCT